MSNESVLEISENIPLNSLSRCSLHKAEIRVSRASGVGVSPIVGSMQPLPIAMQHGG
jgi:hypothetical protein